MYSITTIGYYTTSGAAVERSADRYFLTPAVLGSNPGVVTTFNTEPFLGFGNDGNLSIQNLPLSYGYY